MVWAPIGQAVTPRQGVIFLADAQGAAVTVQAPFSTDRLLPLDFEPRAVAFPTTPAGRVERAGDHPGAQLQHRRHAGRRVPARLRGLRHHVVRLQPDGESGAFCDITVVFQPTKAGPLAADVVVFGPFYGPDAQEVVKLSGTGAAPAPLDDVASVRAGATVTIDPRSNDRDPAGAALSVPTIVTPPSVGTATVGADGIVTYVALAAWRRGPSSASCTRSATSREPAAPPRSGSRSPPSGACCRRPAARSALLLALAVAFVLAGLGARRIAQGARVGRR